MFATIRSVLATAKEFTTKDDKFRSRHLNYNRIVHIAKRKLSEDMEENLIEYNRAAECVHEPSRRVTAHDAATMGCLAGYKRPGLSKAGISPLKGTF